MNFRLRHTVQTLVLVATTTLWGSGLLTSCSNYDTPESIHGDGGLVLRIHLDNSRAARAESDNPNGGEHGDGLRQGEHHENDIETIALFYYNHPDGINAPDGTEVTKIAYIDDVAFHPTNNERTAEIELSSLLYRHTANDQFIVCTNSEDFNVTTLGELRNKVTGYAWKPSADGVKANFDHFVMSNEANSSFQGGSGTKADPDVITVDVERIMGRLDFCTDGSVIDGTRLRYEATDGPLSQKVGDVYLSHVRAFNVMQPLMLPYLIKRLGIAASPTVEYLAEEWRPAQRMVIEPRTWLKNAPDTELWFGETAFDQMIALGDSWFRDEDRVHTSTEGNGFTDGVSVDATDPTDIQRFYVVDYANENTMEPHNTTSQTTTGLLLKAVYQPAVVYKAGTDLHTLQPDESYVCGQTFWRYRPFEAVFAETQTICFTTEAAALAYQAANPEVIADVTCYTDGQCYYPVYLRHDNSHGTPNIDLMEFGIVRNNIYRLKVEFTGPGLPSLTPEIFDEPEGLRPYIFVRKWYKIQHPIIEI